jgi:2'-5' RNA ligase
MKDTLRAFIAVAIPREIRDAIGDILRKLKKTGADARWVKPENMHLTLRFLGNDVPRETVEAIGTMLHRHLSTVEQFTITMEGLGAFPNVTRPRVVWLGIEPPDGPLPALREAVENAVQEAGWPRDERRFAAHLTLGRVKSKSGIGKLRRVLESGGNDPVGSTIVDSVALIRSNLTRNGPVYETLTKVPLRPPRDC